MNKKILIISLIIVFLIIITTTSVLIIKYQSTSKTITPGPAPTPGPVPTSKPNPNPTPGPGPAPGPGPGPAPTPVPGKSQTFNIQTYYFFGRFDPDRIRQIFTKSGTIKSFTGNLSINTKNDDYGMDIGLLIVRGDDIVYSNYSLIYFPPNLFSDENIQLDVVDEDISVQQGDELFIGTIQGDSVKFSGTITVNFI